ncbi:ORF14 [Fowl aviadenovirus A]|nr:ORF14 [Fowl aviadenovirus A]WNM87976.1 ORF14 [Fowl aviadenovirus A]WNM88015.1 ORF14 [Fowl aviadenovirus A]WNM88288.1 ORF14 [Fowl aviadenovirus A]WNM88327.1 ORF14 [Fowl aviadenovirus A]
MATFESCDLVWDSDNDEDEPQHSWHIYVEPLFTRVGITLITDPDFLLFLLRRQMYPFKHSSPYCITDEECDLQLRPFCSWIRVVEMRCTDWTIQYICSCETPRSLFCLSLIRVLTAHWAKTVVNFVAQHDHQPQLPLNLILYTYATHCRLCNLNPALEQIYTAVTVARRQGAYSQLEGQTLYVCLPRDIVNYPCIACFYHLLLRLPVPINFHVI